MISRIILPLLLLIGSCILLKAQEIPVTTINGHECVQGELLIKFKKSPLKAANRKILQRRKTLLKKYSAVEEKKYKIGAEHWKLDTLKSDYDLKSSIDSLNAHPDVEYAEPNYIFHIDKIPNDPYFIDQWSLKNNGEIKSANIGTVTAWNETTGDSSIIVGVIDVGIDYNHEDLKENIWLNEDEIPNNGIDDDNNGYIDDVYGYDFYYNDASPLDDNGHGTHVAGIIGAKGNNGIGICGIAWDIQLMPLKVSCVGGEITGNAAILAVEYAINNGANIINMSWGGALYSKTIADAIQSTADQGIFFVVSAGNNSSDNDQIYQFPANLRLENLISVASTDNDDEISSFSNWGVNTVDVAAPGSNIISTLPNNTYGIMSGTSMAAPHVSGAIALLMSKFPSFTPYQIKGQILESSEKLEKLNEFIKSGKRLSLYSALHDTFFIPIRTNVEKIKFDVTDGNNPTKIKNFTIENTINSQIEIDSIITVEDFKVRSLNGFFSNEISSLTIEPKMKKTIQVLLRPSTNKSYSEKCKIYFTFNDQNDSIEIELEGLSINEGTIVPEGAISGLWSKINSPYYINGDICVKDTNSLIIEPGVSVIFNGHYSITVFENARLHAVGSKTDSIYFTAIDSIIGWNGIRILHSVRANQFNYCNFFYAKRGYLRPYDLAVDGFGGALFINDRDVNNALTIVRNSTFRENTAMRGAALCFYNLFNEKEYKKQIDSCKFIKNIGFTSIIEVGGGAFEFYITNCEFDSNKCYFGNGIITIGSSENNKKSDSHIYISRCKFINTLSRKSIISFGSNMLVANCLFLDNNSTNLNSQISIFSDYYSKYFIINNNFINNSNGFVQTSNWNNLVLRNNIAWDNSTPKIFPGLNDMWNQNINCNNLQDYVSGPGNISLDPMFDNRIDYTLNPQSPCLNSGFHGDFYRDSDGSINDMGMNGGNGVFVLEDSIQFGIANLNNINKYALYPLRITNLKSNENIIDSLSFRTKDFCISDTCAFPIVIESNSTAIIPLIFKPIEEGIRKDTLLVYSNDNPLYESKLPVQGIGVDKTIISGNLKDTLKLAYSPYYMPSECTVSENDTLVIEAGVRLFIYPDVDFVVNGFIKIMGTETNPVLFTCSDSTKLWGRLNIKSEIDYDEFEVLYDCGISANNLIFERSNGMEIESNLSSISTYGLKNFSNCIFRNNEHNYREYLFLLNDFIGIKFKNCIFHNNKCWALFQAKGNLHINTPQYFLDLFPGPYHHEFINCYFNNNEGIMRNDGGIIGASNCTFINNSGLFELLHGELELSNTILYQDRTVQIYSPNKLYSSTKVKIRNSIVRGGQEFIILENASDELHWGNSNLNIDPKITVFDKKYEIEPLSPCINNGSTDSLSILESDLVGNLRIWDNSIDIGCIEYNAPEIINVEICDGENYNGHFTSGAYIDTIAYDSIVATNLTVNSTFRSIEYVDICEGEQYKKWNETGIYTENLETVNGCDSIVETILTVRKHAVYDQVVRICEGETHKGWTEPGTYTESFTSQFGCDSTVTTHLAVNEVYEVTEDVEICQGEDYLGWSETGTYERTLTSVSGCDSLVITNLTVNPVFETEESITICEGGSHKGWTEPGTYTESLTSQFGCDSSVTTHLTVNEVYEATKYIEICEGEDYQGWTETGTYEQTLISANGCDSVIAINLTVHSSYEPAIAVLGDTLKSVDSYSVYQWYDENGEVEDATGKNYVISNSGEYHLAVIDENGCMQNSAVVNAIYSPTDIHGLNKLKYSVIPNPNRGIFTFRLNSKPVQNLTLKLINPLGQLIEVRTIEHATINHSEQFDVSHLSKGIYHLIITTGNNQNSEKIVVQ